MRAQKGRLQPLFDAIALNSTIYLIINNLQKYQPKISILMRYILNRYFQDPAPKPFCNPLKNKTFFPMRSISFQNRLNNLNDFTLLLLKYLNRSVKYLRQSRRLDFVNRSKRFNICATQSGVLSV